MKHPNAHTIRIVRQEPEPAPPPPIKEVVVRGQVGDEVLKFTRCNAGDKTAEDGTALVNVYLNDYYRGWGGCRTISIGDLERVVAAFKAG